MYIHGKITDGCFKDSWLELFLHVVLKEINHEEISHVEGDHTAVYENCFFVKYMI